ncbi:hypothetical protein AAFF_G00163950 [Aldrovandia affinis]|uniref:Uncharacterized protein n=1 Tax=Aldrovandia affinis TaxID=143900 RepID=A0AAD7SZE1_9TELE|nr:hypothetical protein AAFF_G00163950 [Aldrovandia affinis]
MVYRFPQTAPSSQRQGRPVPIKARALMTGSSLRRAGLRHPPIRCRALRWQEYSERVTNALLCTGLAALRHSWEKSALLIASRLQVQLHFMISLPAPRANEKRQTTAPGGRSAERLPPPSVALRPAAQRDPHQLARRGLGLTPPGSGRSSLPGGLRADVDATFPFSVARRDPGTSSASAQRGPRDPHPSLVMHEPG